MRILVLGASGATGRLVVEQLIKRRQRVRIIVRSSKDLSSMITDSDLVEVTYASVLDLTDQQMIEQVQGCEAVVSCLGHNLTFKGIFGQPRRLVTDAIKRVYRSINAIQPATPIKLVLMSTTGFQNQVEGEKVSMAHRAIVSLLRVTLPPHVDNEQAALFLQAQHKQLSKCIEWAAVRPDSLVDHTQVTPYHLHASPLHDPIFDSQKTSRINVAHFIVELVTTPRIWDKWRSKLPVIYNESF